MQEIKSQKKIWLEKILRWMAIVILKKYNPKIIGITGSVGKTSTKEAVFSVLASRYRVRRNEKNYNNEIGIPLTIIGVKSGEGSFWGWLAVSLKWLVVVLSPFEYPEILVLEMGADKPGDMQYLTEFIKPTVGIVTDVSPSHIEFFKTLENIAKEKGTLVRELDENGLAILNADNEYALKLKDQIKAEVITCGFTDEAQMKASGYSFVYTDEREKEIRGLTFKLNYKGTTIPVRLNNILAKHQIYAALMAVAVGVHFEINLVEIAGALENFSSPCGRMNLLKGIKNTQLIDDTYNASPVSTCAALEVLGEIKAKRKIAVLGDMLELGDEEEIGHRQVARKFLEIKGDIFIAMGKRMQFAISELKNHNFDGENVFYFESPEAAGKKLQEIMQEGDLILVKGSQGSRMEKVLEEVIFETLSEQGLLCRQSNTWKKKPFKLG